MFRKIFNPVFLSQKKRENLAATLLIFIFFLLSFVSVVRGYALTTDEDKHYLYGEKILLGDSNRFNPSTMPVTALNALPRRISTFISNERISYLLEKYALARMITVFFSGIVAFFVFHWSRTLFGFVPALFSLIFYLFDPNIIAHSQLVTTDIYMTGALVCTFYFLWKFANDRSIANGLLFFTALGVSQVVKYTAVVLFPLSFLALFIYDLVTQRKEYHLLREIKKYSIYLASSFVITILIINIGFLFNRSFVPFKEYHLRSVFFRNIQEKHPLLGEVPIPVPYPFLGGIDFMSDVEARGSADGNIYLLGHVREDNGFPGYYFVASFLKLPISTQIFLWLAVLIYIIQIKSRSSFIKNELFIFVPVLFLTIYFNFFFKTQAGIRYYLPVFPLLYVFSGNLFVSWYEISKKQKVLSSVLIIYLVGSTLSYHPHYLSYFNEVVLNRMHGYKYLADSNIDWGQDKNEFKQYLAEHPSALYNPNRVRDGHFVIRINDLVGVTGSPEKYAWVRDYFEPVNRIGYSYLIYKISPEEILQLCTITDYCDK